MAPRKCCVPKCKNSDLQSKLTEKKIAFFQAPKEQKERTTWSQILQCNLLPNFYVCEKHFPEEKIILASNNSKRLQKETKPKPVFSKSKDLQEASTETKCLLTAAPRFVILPGKDNNKVLAKNRSMLLFDNIEISKILNVKREYPELETQNASVYVKNKSGACKAGTLVNGQFIPISDQNKTVEKGKLLNLNSSEGKALTILKQTISKENVCCCICKNEFANYLLLIKHCMSHKESKIGDVNDSMFKILLQFEKLQKEVELLKTKNNQLNEDKKLLQNNVDSLQKQLLNYGMKQENQNIANNNFEDANEDYSIDFEYFDPLDNENSVDASVSNFVPFKVDKCDDRKNIFNKVNVSNEIQLHNLVELKTLNCDNPELNVDIKLPLQNFMLSNSREKASSPKSSLISRKREAKSKQIFKCGFCSKLFLCKQNLMSHTKTHQQSFDKYYKCSYCLESFTDSALFKTHLKLHDNLKKFHCGKCSRRFDFIYHRNFHARKHFDKNDFTCDICNEVFVNKDDLFNHVRTHFTVLLEFECDYCHKIFLKKKGLRNHIPLHMDEYTYYCKICSKGFKSKTYLMANHMQSHSAYPFKCSICKEILLTDVELKNHKHTVHLKKKLCKCTICSREFHSEYRLKCHMRVHTGEKPFLCSFCGRDFLSRSILSKHTLLKHTGGDNFQCDYCKKFFPHKTNLERHIMAHTGYKPYVCHYCGKSCREMGNLNKHIRTHTGEKPTRCSICSKGFSTNALFISHLEKHHPDTLL